MSFLKNVDTNLLLIGAVLGAGWWIQGSMIELREENAKSWMELKKDSDERFYEQLKEIRNISERVAVIETKIQ